MPTKNLWGDLDVAEVSAGPKAILQEQAEILTEAMKQRLVGRVVNVAGRGGNGFPARKFAYSLEITVPELNGYAYTVLSVYHDVDFYPVKLVCDRPEVIELCESEEHFCAVLQRILSSKEVKDILGRLLSLI